MRTSDNYTPNYDMNDPSIFISKYLMPELENKDAKILICRKQKAEEGGWAPEIFNENTSIPADTHNLYICMSAVTKVTEQGPHYNQYRALDDYARETFMFMLDDLGDETTIDTTVTKYQDIVKILPPTWLIETSPNNYQALYVLAKTLTNMAIASRISKALPSSAGTDKGAVNKVRWVRLPGGINNKTKYITDEHPNGFPTRVKLANPDTKYHTQEIIDAFQLKGINTTNKRAPVALISEQPTQKPEGWARHVSALCAIPPECDYPTWFNVACVLHAWDEQGLEAFIAWSQASTVHNLSEAEITSKFNDVKYDSKNPGTKTNVVSWPWLQCEAMKHGWDYDKYSHTEMGVLLTHIKTIKTVNKLTDYLPEIYNRFLSQPDYGYVASQVQAKYKELGVVHKIGEVRLMITPKKNLGPNDSCWTYPLTDKGNHQRFRDLYTGIYYYIPELNHHLEWDNDHWKKTHSPQGIAMNTIEHIIKCEKNQIDEEQRKQLNKWSIKCEGFGHISPLTTMIKRDETIYKSIKEFNKSPTHLGIATSVLSLETGMLTDNVPDNLITLKTRYGYDSDADCPRWKQFVLEIMNGNKEMANFLQRLAGYALHGKNPESQFIILNGSGANGKSTFVNTLVHILGDYGAVTSPATLVKPAFNKTASAASPDLIRLFQKRLVICNEWDENTFLNESLVKSLTGGSDPISVRALYANSYLEYVPEYLIMLATNHLPRIASMGYGIWRRLLIIPFDVNFSDAEHIKQRDSTLFEYFKNEEHAGILNWMIEGYQMWKEKSIEDSMPEHLIEIKEEYKAEMDTIAQFIQEDCVIEDTARIPSAELYQHYNNWCIQNGNHAKASRTFSRAIADRGYKRVRIGTINGFEGIRQLSLGERRDLREVINEPIKEQRIN